VSALKYRGKVLLKGQIKTSIFHRATNALNKDHKSGRLERESGGEKLRPIFESRFGGIEATASERQHQWRI